jgi:hypothetical protein
VLASYCSWLAVTTSRRCSSPLRWFEFDAVVVLRVIGGLRFGSAGSGVGEKTAAKLLGPFGTGR